MNFPSCLTEDDRKNMAEACNKFCEDWYTQTEYTMIKTKFSRLENILTLGSHRK